MRRLILLALWVGAALSAGPGLSPRMVSPTVDQRIQDARNRGTPSPSQSTDDDTILVELDMKMTRRQWEQFHEREDGYKGLRNETFRWTNNTVPYVINNAFTSSEKAAIRRGLDEWEKFTCLKFVERTTQKNYVQVINDYGCYSMVGMQGDGSQSLSLARSGCIYHHTIVHEFGHAIGFHHEQTRPDRDTYVKINFENIQSGQAYNFKKYSTKLINDQGVKYDYWSVMHYSAYAFSIGGKTIETLDSDKGFDEVIGSVPGLSFKDIQAANKMYKCDKQCTNQCPAKAIRSKDCKCWCNTLRPGSPVVEWDGSSECKGGDDATDSCVDYFEECSDWAEDGECDANAYFMNTNCRKSCKICGPDAKCKDYHTNCEYWKVIGECSSNPGWMNANCRKACGVCGEPPQPGDCKDSLPKACRSAADDGHCEAYAWSMLWECPQACKICGDDKICRNWDILCPTWKEMGECEKNPTWMNRHCAKACGQCTGGNIPDCKNYYHSDKDCDYWAGTGECVTNPGWMLYNCAKSCRVCGDNADCLNYSPNCYSWKLKGLCESDKPGMNFHCPLACKKCTSDGKDTEDCENHDFNCERWEEAGECDKNPLFMLNYCPRSCRMCGPNPVCKNFHEKCEEWAEAGECKANPGYMRLHCRPACGLCTSSSTTPGATTTTSRGGSTPSTTPGNRPRGCTEQMPEVCEDYPHVDHDCAYRASIGECDSDPHEMYRVCRKSCNMCGENVQCKDYNTNCPDWAATRQCEANPSNMYIFCYKSCGCC